VARPASHRKSGPLATPIAQTSTFSFASSAELKRYLQGEPGDDGELFLYSRYANPTVRDLEDTLASLEGAERALAFSSGMAALSTAMIGLLKPGDEVLASASLYGGTSKLLRNILGPFGVTSRFLSLDELRRLDEFVTPRSKLLVFESPTNPQVDVIDIEGLCAQARKRGLVVLFDNTFASPVLQQPLSLGVDIVMHSLTKSLAGHSDVVAGALAGRADLIERIHGTAKILGGCLDPHAAFLTLRGIKSVHLRVERACRNALAIAQAIASHPKLEEVRYPGLPSHPGHEVARRQMRAFGSMICVTVRGGLAAAERVFDRLGIFERAASLGGVESLASLPVHTSHFGLSESQLALARVDPGMIRLSVGIEDEEDLISDLRTAFE
jgi:methionine-gamma-lyase